MVQATDFGNRDDRAEIRLNWRVPVRSNVRTGLSGQCKYLERHHNPPNSLTGISHWGFEPVLSESGGPGRDRPGFRTPRRACDGRDEERSVTQQEVELHRSLPQFKAGPRNHKIR